MFGFSTICLMVPALALGAPPDSPPSGQPKAERLPTLRPAARPIEEVQIGPMIQDVGFRTPWRLDMEEELPTDKQLAAISIAPEVRAAVSSLASNDWAERERTEAQLVASEDPSLQNQLMAVVVQDELEPEQRHRIVSIIVRRLIETPRGALGIQMENEFARQGNDGVRVGGTIRGMPAHTLLFQGDVIVGIDGRPMRDSRDLVNYVQELRPGRPVILIVERPRKGPDGRSLRDENMEMIFDRIEVPMKLGSAEDLDRPDRRGLGGGAVDTVLRRRANQASDAARRFAPPVVDVPIDVPDEAMPDPDAHQSVSELRTYRRLIDEGAITVSPDMHRRWTTTLNDLRLRSTAPGTPEEMRVYLRAVAQRIEELLPPLPQQAEP
jgi:hypothetical protein